MHTDVIAQLAQASATIAREKRASYGAFARNVLQRVAPATRVAPAVRTLAGAAPAASATAAQPGFMRNLFGAMGRHPVRTGVGAVAGGYGTYALGHNAVNRLGGGLGGANPEARLRANTQQWRDMSGDLQTQLATALGAGRYEDATDEHGTELPGANSLMQRLQSGNFGGNTGLMATLAPWTYRPNASTYSSAALRARDALQSEYNRLAGEHYSGYSPANVARLEAMANNPNLMPNVRAAIASQLRAIRSRGSNPPPLSGRAQQIQALFQDDAFRGMLTPYRRPGAPSHAGTGSLSPTASDYFNRQLSQFSGPGAVTR